MNKFVCLFYRGNLASLLTLKSNRLIIVIRVILHPLFFRCVNQVPDHDILEVVFKRSVSTFLARFQSSLCLAHHLLAHLTKIKSGNPYQIGLNVFYTNVIYTSFYTTWQKYLWTIISTYPCSSWFIDMVPPRMLVLKLLKVSFLSNEDFQVTFLSPWFRFITLSLRIWIPCSSSFSFLHCISRVTAHWEVRYIHSVSSYSVRILMSPVSLFLIKLDTISE